MQKDLRPTIRQVTKIQIQNQTHTQSSRRFDDEQLWKQSYGLISEIYAITTYFPKHERYGLLPMVRKSAIKTCTSITRYFTVLEHIEKQAALSFASCFAHELLVHIRLADDLGYFSSTEESYIDDRGFLQHRQQLSEKQIRHIITKVEQLAHVLTTTLYALRKSRA
ncbi:four helix bundle protein [Candidatus Woesearchaeota archaeon]|nr:four helix bundle protein [Candidatus Woesearchaeota archaeon]